jgi:shikimate dehydrogenase
MSLAALAGLTDNPLAYPQGRSFAAILGASPSKGARSPALWNAAFKAHGSPAEMLPVDVPAERLAPLLAALEKDPGFLGGAVAIPHKEAAARWLGDRVTPEAGRIGAVNCLYRGDDGRLAGTNTDGEGALVSYESRFGPLRGKIVLLLGLGGAGKAVAAFMARGAQPGGCLLASSRSEQGRAAAARLGAEAWVPWSGIPEALASADVLVNCTSVGSGAQAGLSPLTPEELERLPKRARVFDIVYQPSPTVLVQQARALGLEAMDGAAMNLEQAVLAFGRAAPEPKGRNATRAAMEAAKRALDSR